MKTTTKIILSPIRLPYLLIKKVSLGIKNKFLDLAEWAETAKLVPLLLASMGVSFISLFFVSLFLNAIGLTSIASFVFSMSGLIVLYFTFLAVAILPLGILAAVFLTLRAITRRFVLSGGAK
ncbi:hypothetical protein [Salinicola aestuarinus]|uniref:hypothetical protein n=1 Tax=Salinicola aestuarinus TaxID=1949082 RepID=UPI000DA1ECA7|nr:hypothetical protein [Salinicola aestuarinus]